MTNKENTKTLYGNVNLNDYYFEWHSEPGACEKCQSMDGKTFDDANTIPDKPHPNCKCWLERKKHPSSDPIQQRRDKIQEQKDLELEFKKLQGDLSCLEDQCNAIINLINEKLEIINDIQNNYEKQISDIDSNKLQDIKIKFQNNKKDLLQTQYKIKNTNSNIHKQFEKQTLKNYGGTIKEISKWEMEISSLKTKIDNFFVNIVQPNNTSIVAKFYKIIFDTPEAYNLLMIGLDKNYNQNYINKNGKIYKNLYELEYIDLQKEIATRLNMEKEKPNLENVKIVFIKENSSIACKIAQSKSFRKFFNKNVANIMSNNMPKNSELVFENTDSDLYGALHSTAIKNIMLDENKNLHFEIHDFYNFNPNRTSVKGRVGYKLQQQGAIKPYYIIIKVFVPNDIIDFYFKDYYKYAM